MAKLTSWVALAREHIRRTKDLAPENRTKIFQTPRWRSKTDVPLERVEEPQ